LHYVTLALENVCRVENSKSCALYARRIYKGTLINLP